MALASYKNGSDIYTVNLITDIAQIDSDIARVQDKILDTPLDLYKQNMELSIQQRLAYEIFKNSTRIGFVYNIIEADIYKGASIYIKDLAGMVIGMKTMFEICDMHKLVFKPHENSLFDFKSMILGRSLRAWHSGEETVTILKEDIVPKGKKIFYYLGIEEL